MKHLILSFLFSSVTLTIMAQNHGAIQLQHFGFAQINFAETQFFLGDQLLGNADASGFFQPKKAAYKKMTVVNPMCDTLLMEELVSKNDYVFARLKSKEGMDSIAKAAFLESYVPKCGDQIIEKNCDSLAQFEAGDGALKRFLGENIRYPQNAIENEVSGRVYLTFIVDELGKVGCVEIARSSGDNEIDREAVRVAKMLPKFKPAMKNGTDVKSIYLLPVTFILQ